MELPADQSSARLPPPQQKIGLHGPKPTPLKLRKDSHKIKKPPPAPPVIIYTVSPKVIHTNPTDFMSLVQRLTGPGPTSSTSTLLAPSGGGSSSTSTLCGSIEKTDVPLGVGGLDTTGYGLFGDRPGGGFGQKMLSAGPVGLIRPIPQKLFPLPNSDPSPFINSYHQDNQDFFCGVDYDQLLQDHHDFYGGGNGGSAFFTPSCPVLSPTSVELLRELLNQ